MLAFGIVTAKNSKNAFCASVGAFEKSAGMRCPPNIGVLVLAGSRRVSPGIVILTDEATTEEASHKRGYVWLF